MLSPVESTVVDFLEHLDLGTYISGKPSQHIERTVEPETYQLTDPTLTPVYLEYLQARRTYQKLFAPTAVLLSDSPIFSSFSNALDATYATEAKPTNPPPVFQKPTSADTAVSQLMGFETFGDNWDGNGANRPIPQSVGDAKVFIRQLAPESIIPKPAMHADGHAVLFWNRPEAYAELEFLGDNKISCYVRRGEKQWSDEISFVGSELPQELLAIGFARI